MQTARTRCCTGTDGTGGLLLDVDLVKRSAIGEVLRDQLFYLHRVGFDAYAIREGKDIEDALKALNDFSETYQAAVDEPLPLFRRRGRAA